MYGKVIGTGSYIPEHKVTNEDLTKIMETSDEWIYERTGIRSRHVMVGENTADMAVKASLKAIEDAKITAEEIDMIILSSVSSNLILPNTACYVQAMIGAKNASCFDMNTACTGFIMAYNTVQSFIHTGLIKTALIIGAEGLSKIVDWNDRGTAILFGDGAGAAIVRADENAVFHTVMHADGEKGIALYGENEFASRKLPEEFGFEEKEAITPYGDSNTYEKKTYVQMDGREVFRFAVSKVPEGIKELMDQMEITVDDIDWFILHQANERIVSGVAKRIKAPSEKVPLNMMEYGNMSSACIPVLLDEMRKEKKIVEGDKVIMSGFGAGLTWAATYIIM